MSRRRRRARKRRSAEGSGARRQAAGLSAGVLPQAGGVGGVQGAQARPAGDGVRHAVRAGGIPQHPDPRLDPVSPVAAAGLSRRQSAINWPIIKGEKETGLSIFWPDNGLDTGDVLLQKKTPISDTDTLGTVYFDRLFPMGVEAMLESVDLVKAGKAPRIKQDESQGHLRRPLRRRQRPASTGASPGEQIDRLIRGCNPAPGAWTTLDGKHAQDFRRQAAAGEGPQGHRRQDGRDRRGRGRRLHRGLRRRPLQGHARAARRRQEGRSRRMGASPPTSPPARGSRDLSTLRRHRASGRPAIAGTCGDVLDARLSRA